MSSRLQELADRRHALVAQSEALRQRLAASTQGLDQVLGIADLAVGAGRYIKHRPLLLLLGMASAPLVVQPRRSLRGLSFATAPSSSARCGRSFPIAERAFAKLAVCGTQRVGGARRRGVQPPGQRRAAAQL